MRRVIPLRRTVLLASVLGAAAIVALVAWQAISGGVSGYRTASVRLGSVQGTLTLAATIMPSDRLTLSFGVSGMVATVGVSIGQKVTAGQTLATLVATTLGKQVTRAQSTLGAAQAALIADESAQSQSAPTGRTPPSAGGGAPQAGSTSASGSTAPGSGGTSTGALAADQQSLVRAQQSADGAQQSVAATISAMNGACSTVSTGRGTGTGTTAKGSPTGPTPNAATANGSCTSALNAAWTAEQSLTTDLQAVSSAEGVLASWLSTHADAHTTPPSPRNGTGGGSTGRPSPTGRGTGPHTAVTNATTSLAASTADSRTAQLASDQSTVDSDKAAVIQAQQALAESQLVTPSDGTVAAVDLTAGEAVGASSSTAIVTIVSKGSFEAVASATPAQVPELAKGDHVTVTVDGRTGTLSGRITRIGPVDVSNGDSYPVVVALPPGTLGLFTGADAQMSLVVRSADHVLVAPTSAVHTTAGRSYVLILHSDRMKKTPVAVGVVARVYTQLRSGARLGETLVLAELTKPVPKPAGTVARRSGNANQFPPFFHRRIFFSGGAGAVTFTG